MSALEEAKEIVAIMEQYPGIYDADPAARIATALIEAVGLLEEAQDVVTNLTGFSRYDNVHMAQVHRFLEENK